MASEATRSGPDLAIGVPDADVREGVPLLGHVGSDAIVLVRDGTKVHALGATCAHYGGPLAEGNVFDGAIHCPWPHACYDLETGRASVPGLAPTAYIEVALVGGKLRVGGRREVRPRDVAAPRSVVIVGGGAAGVACAEALRAEGHRGAITIVSGEGTDPVDRPNLSKDYLAGTAQEEWVFLRTADALAASEIELVRERATAIDP